MFLMYRSKHLATNTITEHECECESAADLLRHINLWNIQGNGNYVYTTMGKAMMPLMPTRLTNTKVISQERTIESVYKADGYWTEVKDPNKDKP